MEILGTITLGIALGVLIIAGLITLERALRELEGMLLVVAVVTVIALLSTSTAGFMYALKAIAS